VRRWSCWLVVLSFVSSALVVAAPALATTSTTLYAGGYLRQGEQLVSANGRYHAKVDSEGRLVVRTTGGRVLWATPRTGATANLYLAVTGQLVLKVAGEVRWRTGTAGSGANDRLRMRDNGELALYAGRLFVWSNRAPNGCPRLTGKTFVVDLSAQRARLCKHGEQLRTTLVTTGATALGYGTPTGTWHTYARVRNTTLYPAAGGGYPVKYWLPYDGPYGVHDSPWQNFAYGSNLYKTRGSHGCIHVPGPMMAWLFAWAPVGTRVRVHR
jgi:hypothetical protein